jgi:hypothetical protein
MEWFISSAEGMDGMRGGEVRKPVERIKYIIVEVL